jgi:glycosyltransferase involved in cell wall biosynthesis
MVQSYDISGRSTVIHELSGALPTEEFHSFVVSLSGSVLYAVNHSGVRCVSLNKNEGFDFAALFKLKKMIREYDIHILHTHGQAGLLYGVLIKRWAGVKTLIHSVHRADGDIPSGSRWLRRIFYSQVDRIVAVSQAAGAAFAQRNSLGVDNIITIYNGIDLGLFENLGSPPKREGFTFGTVANLSTDKDPETLILAFYQLLAAAPAVKLLIVGNGPKYSELLRLIDRLRISHAVRLLGFQVNVLEWLSRMDVFVLSTKTEGLGVSLLEAMAARVPSVASDVGGIREIIAQRINGLLVPAGDVVALKEAMLALYQNPGLRSQFQRNGYQTVKDKFSRFQMAEKYMNLYKEASRA